MEKELPIFKVQINEDTDSELEVDFVALVDSPAVQYNFLAFSENKRRICLRIDDNERRIVSGVAMLADTPIYRRDDTGYEYYTVFDKETIYKMVQKFYKKGYQQNVNLMHDESQQVYNVTIFESFISDKERGILPMRGFEDVPDGSWFISMYVEDDETWQRIKDGDLRGFSIEGLFTFEKVPAPEQYNDEKTLQKVIELLAQWDGTE